MPKISELTAGTAARTDQIPVNQGGTTKRVTGHDLSAMALDPTKVIVFNSNYANLQAAIDAAEALAAASSDYGVTVLIPPGDFSAQNALIKKNVSLFGLSGSHTNCRIGTLTFRPSSTTAGPTLLGISNLNTGTLTIINETAAGSGVFNPDEPSGIIFENCNLTSPTLTKVSNITFKNCAVFGQTSTFNYCENIAFYNSIFSTIVWKTDDSLANLPTGYSGGSPSFHQSTIVGASTFTKLGGSTTTYFNSVDSFFEDVTVTDGDIRVEGGAIKAITMAGTSSFLDFTAYSPFLPAVSGDWTSAPKYSHTALDELAARDVETTFSATFTQSVGAKTVVVRKHKKMVTIEIPSGSTSDGGGGTIASGATELPAAYRPAADLSFSAVVTNNNAKVDGRLVVGSAGALTFTVGAAGGTFTDNQPAGFDRIAVSYTLA